MLNQLIKILQTFDPILISLLSLLVFFTIITICFKIWGEVGLYLFIIVAIIGANLQVIKVSYFEIFGEPVALGTVLFASTYLCTDILNEFYGVKSARRGVMLGFGAMLIWTMITQITLAYAPLTPVQAGTDYGWAIATHDQMSGLFSLFPAIFIAGISAYLVSQFHDVYIYNFIRKKFEKHLWLRNNLSTMISSLIDNFIFSFIAFNLLSNDPIPLKTLLVTYVFGTYAIRVVVALFDTPFLYFTRYLFRRQYDRSTV